MKYKTFFDGLARPFVLIAFTLGVLFMAIMQIPIVDFVKDAYMVVLGFFFATRTAEKVAEGLRRNREPDIFRAQTSSQMLAPDERRPAVREQSISSNMLASEPPPDDDADVERLRASMPVHRDVTRAAGGLRK